MFLHLKLQVFCYDTAPSVLELKILALSTLKIIQQTFSCSVRPVTAIPHFMVLEYINHILSREVIISQEILQRPRSFQCKLPLG